MTYRDFISTDFDRSVADTPYMVKQNTDELRQLNNWRFQTEEECLLAIALWLATPEENREINHFRHTFKNVLRMIGANTVWTH
jgi:hypothetical protein